MELSSTLHLSLPPSARMTHLWPIADLMEYAKQKQDKEPSQEGVGFRPFVNRANPRFVFYPHCELLAKVCERVTSGELKRVMIQLPPRHSKSELFSRLFSAYYLHRNPHHFVGINSYSAD